MPLPLDSYLFWLLAICGVVLTGISKSGFAGGAGVVAVPLLALVIGVPEATALMLPLLLIMDARTISYYRQHANWRELGNIVPASLAGIVVASLLLGTLSDSLLKTGLGVLCLLFAGWQSLAPLLGRFRQAGILWGTLSGASSTLIHAGGPPINIYFTGRQLPKLSWLATAGLFFGIMNVVKIVPYTLLGLWNSQLIIVAALLTPAAFLGVWLGKKIQDGITENQFMLFSRALLAGSGVLLLFHSQT